MHPVLRLYEDVLSTAETIEFQLPPLPRFIYVVHGSALIAGETVNAGETWQGEGPTLVRPGADGVSCWRWELSRGDQGSTVASAPGMTTHEKLTAFLETIPKGELLMRGGMTSCTEVGPGKVLQGLVKRIAPTVTTAGVDSWRDVPGAVPVTAPGVRRGARA